MIMLPRGVIFGNSLSLGDNLILHSVEVIAPRFV